MGGGVSLGWVVFCAGQGHLARLQDPGAISQVAA